MTPTQFRLSNTPILTVALMLTALALPAFAREEFAPRGEPFFLVGTEHEGQTFADIAVAANGDYAMVYRDQETDPEGEIRVRVFSPTAEPREDSNRVDGNTTVIDGGLVLPAISALANSAGWVAVWQSFNQDGDGSGIYGQLLTPLGARSGSEFLINETTSSNQKSPDVAGLPSGGFVAAWTTEDETFGEEVAARIFNSSAVASGGEFFVNAPSVFDDEKPRIGTDAAGNIVIVWEGDTNSGGDEDIYVRRFNGSGVALTNALTVNTASVGDQEAPDVAVRPNGSFVVGWRDREPAPDQGYMRAYDANAVPTSNPIEVGRTERNQSDVRVGFPRANLVVAITTDYEENLINNELTLSTHEIDGELVGERRTIPILPGGVRGVRPTIGFTSECDALAVWEQNSTAGSATDLVANLVGACLFEDGFESGNLTAWSAP